MNSPDENLPLERWIAGIASGDRKAFDRFYEATMPRALAFATRQLMNEDLVDVCIAETYVQVWRDAAKFSTERGCAMAWLFTICRTRGLDLLRARQRQHELSEAVERETEFEIGDGTDDLISAVDAHSAVHPLLAELSADQRRLIGLAFYQGLSHSEIADATGMPIGTVKSYIHRALTALRQRLGGEEREFSEPKGGSNERRAINV
jgi:RNA polymerase sigma-70 factor (ECF subfamily)